MIETKVCQTCKEEKPVEEFYANPHGKQKRMPYCKTCDNARPRKKTEAKVNWNRARHRAVADLIALHEEEFRALHQVRLREAQDEAQQLAQTPEGAQYGKEPVRLRSGKPMPGQKAGDRIDVARCPSCVRSHDRGHVCPNCGTKPGDRIPEGINPADLVKFNQGTARADAAKRR